MGLDQFPVYVESCNNRRFRYGEFDCLTFTNEAVRIIRGVGFADDIIGKYAVNGRLIKIRELRRFAQTLPEFMDKRLVRIKAGQRFPRGSVVAIPTNNVPFYALGVAWGNGAITLAETGTDFTDLEMVAFGWSIAQ